MKSEQSTQKHRRWVYWALFLATVVIVFIIGLFASSIIERRSEAQLYFQMVNPIQEWEPKNEVWGENFPRQYESYVSTSDTSFSSEHGGGATIDYLEKYPELVVMWAGYAFARDYKQGRGHYYAITDIHNTLRTVQAQPATCWTCKSTDVPRLMNKMGVEEFYKSSWLEMGPEVVNHIGCQDCHDPQTMNLRITRPALVEAFRRKGIDINKSTQQEMRSLVCAQCHVEYYFKGDGKYLTFPWDKGFTADDMEAYYDEIQFTDWTHALSRTPMLKAQHPDWEVYRTGVHADRGVACADCHMPYKREGGIKFTDHKIQSPLANISNSCLVCHRESEEKLMANVYERQHKVEELRRLAEKNLATVHLEAKLAWESGASESEMQPVLTLIRHAQWRWDWVAASNAMGFHSPNEALRVLGTSIQKSNEARLLLSSVFHNHNVKYPVQLPDFSTKEKAQSLVGLNMTEIINGKAEFKKNTLPSWISDYQAKKATQYN